MRAARAPTVISSAYKPLTDLTTRPRCLRKRASARRCSCVFRRSPANADRTDTARDVRGFAVKFYTDEGNWDLVGNNIPVFFIQDAMKFPDLVHAVKPEPHHAMPQAAIRARHFLGLRFADARIHAHADVGDVGPCDSAQLSNDAGLWRAHISPGQRSRRIAYSSSSTGRRVAGTHSLVWDEAVKISGADPDFHRRDLWEAIEAGAYPEYELAVQIFTEEQAEQFSFDVLDATKIVPEELVPLQPVGRMVLNRNPDNFFAETEQVAFCTAHIVPGLDFTNDPLLAGRIHSYVDTQITRLGGPNFHEIPINAPVAQVHNNQRDGMHRQAIPRGRVAYEPNSLGGGCPFQAGAQGFRSFPQPIQDDKVRGKPEKFADHYTQATLFFNSQTDRTASHHRAFRFELTKVQTPAIRARMVAGLMNVDTDFAAKVAQGLGIDLPEPLPRVLQTPPTPPEVTRSEGLSLFARPGDGSIRTRRIATAGRRRGRRSFLAIDLRRAERGRRGSYLCRTPLGRCSERRRYCDRSRNDDGNCASSGV